MLLGFDIGGTKCAVILGKAQGDYLMEIIDKVAMPTTQLPYDMIKKLFVAAEELLAQNGVSKQELTGADASA